MNEIYDNQDMTNDEWERYGADFEARYQKHLRSLNTNVQGGRPQRGLRAQCKFFHDSDFSDQSCEMLFPTEEDLQRYLRQAGMDQKYNVMSAMSFCLTPEEDSMASFFLASQDYEI